LAARLHSGQPNPKEFTYLTVHGYAVHPPLVELVNHLPHPGRVGTPHLSDLGTAIRTFEASSSDAR